MALGVERPFCIKFLREAIHRFGSPSHCHLEEACDDAFSPEDRMFASIGQSESLKLWHLRFSADGHHLAVNTDEGKLLLLDAPE